MKLKNTHNVLMAIAKMRSLPDRSDDPCVHCEMRGFNALLSTLDTKEKETILAIAAKKEVETGEPLSLYEECMRLSSFVSAISEYLES